MDKKNRLKFILERFSEGTASSSELAELEQLLNDPEATSLVDELWEKVPASATFFEEGKTEALLSEIEARNQQVQIRDRFRKRRVTYSIAASLAVLLTAATLYLVLSKDKPGNIVAETPETPVRIAPGNDKAILVLADGSTIQLESSNTTNIPAQGNAQITNINDQVIYASGNASAPVVYNTLKTPRGAQYQLQLADGSKVWMNAGSSLHFPTSFPGKERKVELTGEAYFEIAKDAQKPFRVTVNNMQVNVLGTQFNIMAYENETSKAVTLLEGSVNVEHHHQSMNLQPGQQAQSSDQTGLRVVNNIDTEEAVAWKNGYFITNRTSLPVLMRQIERWYNVDVVYEGKIPDKKFGGKIPRKSDLQEVLKVLELSKVYTKLDGNKITILDR
ncbi:FecR family protein [Pseudoflavitalea rhizosphaerae]|uniref:FecR family protein n=1 Tax=Pseudoflavitalea rhizosphaerae TaxID=1884793 RepID=UPI000F8EBBB3|nr:FecR family protein [Pseudoflavitalea rhizosphaerae]